MNIQEIAGAFWTNLNAAPALANLVQGILDAEDDESPPMGTTKLVGRLLPTADAKQMRGILNHLHSARTKGLLDGYFTRGKIGTFGKPSILWKAAPMPKLTNAERRALIAKAEASDEEQF